MDILEITQKVTDGKLLIVLPENLEGKEVKVVVSQTDEYTDPENWLELPGKERLKILQQFAGIAKYPDNDTNKWDVYDQ